MSNSKFRNQLQLFQEKGFKKQLKLKRKPHFQIYQEQSSAEDIFQDMGTKQEQKSEENWRQFYKRRLKQLRNEQYHLSHNEVTQMVSDEWKQVKQLKKAENISNQNLSSQSCLKYEKQYQQESERERERDRDQEVDYNYLECGQFIEKLRESTLKFVINDHTFKVNGKAIMEAINNNQNIVYLNEQQCSSKTESPNQKWVRKEIDEHIQQSDGEQSIIFDSAPLENKLKRFL